jgi:hypothetical protein
MIHFPRICGINYNTATWTFVFTGYTTGMKLPTFNTKIAINLHLLHLFPNLYYLFLFYVTKFYIVEDLGMKTLMKSSFIYPVAVHGPCHMISWQPQVPTLPSSALCCRVVVCLYHMYSTCDTYKQVLCNDLDAFNNNDNSNEGGWCRRRTATRVDDDE